MFFPLSSLVNYQLPVFGLTNTSHYSSYESLDRSVCMSMVEQLSKFWNTAYGVSRYHPCLIIQVINQSCVVLISSLPHTQNSVFVSVRGCFEHDRGNKM